MPAICVILTRLCRLCRVVATKKSRDTQCAIGIGWGCNVLTDQANSLHLFTSTHSILCIVCESSCGPHCGEPQLVKLCAARHRNWSMSKVRLWRGESSQQLRETHERAISKWENCFEKWENWTSWICSCFRKKKAAHNAQHTAQLQS